MHAALLLELACVALAYSARGLRRGSALTTDPDALKTFATFLLAQNQSPILAKLQGSYRNRVHRGNPSRRLLVRLDADRCYYGELDAEGNVLARKRSRIERGTPVMPSPSNTALEVVDAQFLALSRDYDSRSIGDAFAHVSPKIINAHNLDAAKFKSILSGTRMEGIIGLESWEVLSVANPSDERTVVEVKIIPKPIAGCVKTSGVAGGITWPMYFKWELGRVVEGPLAGCWMLEAMTPHAPPAEPAPTIDVDTQLGSDAGSAVPVNAQKRVQTRPNEDQVAA